MPLGDGTGPEGRGARTGRGRFADRCGGGSGGGASGRDWVGLLTQVIGTIVTGVVAIVAERLTDSGRKDRRVSRSAKERAKKR